MDSTKLSRPYVVSWNLTYRCNLACEHCYLDAGAKKARKVTSDAFLDRSELSTEECFGIIDQLKETAPEAVTILTGGEPLLRKDILEIITYGVKQGLWIVVGSNGVLITEVLIDVLKKAGLRGMALSLDALDPKRHDGFRRVEGSWQNTVDGAKLLTTNELPFIVQTTVGKHNLTELNEIADFAYTELGAKVWNLYFLVQTGRGAFVSDISPEEYTEVMDSLYSIQKRYHQKMIVNAKCAPHYVTTLFKHEDEPAALRYFDSGAGGCPAGTHYFGIRPNGDMTPCPYLPVFGGNLKKQSLKEVWEDSELFNQIRERSNLGGICGKCEFSTMCGGCRARAYGQTGDLMAEDPLCNYEVGSLEDRLVKIKARPGVTYGKEEVTEVVWDTDAKERIQKVPAFVRGMVMQRVEKRCKERGQPRVTIEILEKIRSEMPTPKVFRK